MGALRILVAVSALALVLAGCSTSDPDVGSVGPSVSNPSASATVTSVIKPVPEGDVAKDLRAPWSVQRLDQGGALISERDSGVILLLDTATGATREAGRVTNLETAGEGGLMGLAVSDSGDSVFAMYTSPDGNRVVRMPWDGARLGEETALLTRIPRAQFHDGGRLAIGPEGNLFVATGDSGQPDLAQDVGSLAGKILRIKPDGSIPPNNPFGQSPVYSIGHRNVQGLAFDDAGQLWASEFGSQDFDELNLIEPGSNYGWPEVEGPSDDPKFVTPQAWWSPTSVASPSGIAISNGSVWVAALRGETLWQVPIPNGKAQESIAWFVGEFGRLRDVTAGPSDELWVLTNNTDGRGDPRPGDDRILRMKLVEQ